MNGYFPMFVNLEGKKVVCYGGGAIAARRVLKLLDFGCKVTVVAPKVAKELLERQGRNLVIRQETFLDAGLIPGDILLAATDDEEENHKICLLGKEARMLVNNASKREDCDFYFPGIVREQELVVGVCANGKNHKLAKQATEKIKGLLQQETEEG